MSQEMAPFPPWWPDRITTAAANRYDKLQETEQSVINIRPVSEFYDKKFPTVIIILSKLFPNIFFWGFFSVQEIN